MEVNEKNFAPNATLESLIKRIELFMEEQDWNSAISYLERVIDMAPENANVYMLGLLIEYKVNNDEELINLCSKNKKTLDNDKYYKYVQRFGDKNIIDRINNINNRIKEYIDLLEKEELEKVYVDLINTSKTSLNISELNVVLEKLKDFLNFKDDTAKEYEELKKKIEKLKDERKNKNRKTLVKIAIATVILCIIFIICFFIIRQIRLEKFIENEDFNSAGNIEEKFYENHTEKIIAIVDKHISNNEIEKCLSICENLFNYILEVNNIEYDANSELWYRYKQVEGYLSEELKNKYLEIEYKYIVEQIESSNNDERITYSLFSLVFNDEKYSNDINTQYNFIKNKYENFKKNDLDCTTSELSYIRDYFVKLNDFEEASNYVSEIDEALKWQGSWVGFGGYKDRNLYQVAINYYNKKVYTCYISSPWTEKPKYYSPKYGTAKFEFINDNSINVHEESGYPIWSKATINLENDKIVYLYESYKTERIELSRETEEMNFVETANKLLEEHPYKSSGKTNKEKPKIGMSASEVKQSTWGYPDKINKDTYSWGTTEQWVYERGYIYFRNGIVTSISER